MPSRRVLALFSFILVLPMIWACRQSSSASALNAHSPVNAVSPTPSSAEEGVRIITPADGATVRERPILELAAPASAATVWVIVHPMEVADFWVQPKPSNRGNGRWKTQIYIGQPGPRDEGKHFEIMAVADPAQQLKEGMKLSDWPKAKMQSPVIEVVRGK